MGGWGSGDSKGRRKEEDFLRLDVRRLSSLGMLRPGGSRVLNWTRGGQPFASVRVSCVSSDELRLAYEKGGETLSYSVFLHRSSCHYGGQRPWFFCPGEGCSSRVAVLFGTRLFVCRHCRKLSYESQRQSKTDRLYEKRNKLWSRLGVHPSLGDSGIRFATKPKGMHWETFERLKQQALWANYTAIIESAKAFSW